MKKFNLFSYICYFPVYFLLASFSDTFCCQRIFSFVSIQAHALNSGNILITNIYWPNFPFNFFYWYHLKFSVLFKEVLNVDCRGLENTLTWNLKFQLWYFNIRTLSKLIIISPWIGLIMSNHCFKCLVNFNLHNSHNNPIRRSYYHN